jgi:hypothetical protein
METQPHGVIPATGAPRSLFFVSYTALLHSIQI